MLLQRLELRNIRSYTDLAVDFEDGITLLAGDIGAGKSSILHAIEFALFGVRPDLSGEALLRRGERDGSVTLTFVIGNTYTLHRQLKRTSNGVRQDTGWIETDGQRESFTANELKARVLTILGYPDDLLTKRKDLVFRYTVYTPQEEMKQILTDRSADRLDTLRSVFGIDAYRTVQENAQTVAKAFRDDVRELRARVADLPDTEHELETVETRIASLAKDEQRVTQDVTAAQDAREQAERALAEREVEAKQDQRRREELRAARATEEQLRARKERRQHERDTLLAVLAEQREPVEDPAPALDALAETLQSTAEKRAAARGRVQLLTERQEELAAQRDAITTLETCPRCQQPVTDAHKAHIAEDAAAQHATLVQELTTAQDLVDRADRNLARLTERRTLLQELRRAFDAYRGFLESQQRARDRLAALTDEERSVAEEHAALSARISALEQTRFDEQEYVRQQDTVRVLREREAHAHAAFVRVQTQREESQNALERVSSRLATLQARKDELVRMSAQEQWITGAFIPTAALIERHVLAAIHREFSAQFTDWFSVLVEDESLFAALSPDFAPVVTQDGYDADLSHLSGGEKTSVALAYRLALHAVLNRTVRMRTTTDLLILDEPTDGFSSEQLDRVRDVLQRVSCRQIIIVSHEQKMESFVDHVLRVEKQHGVSVIA